MKIDAAQVMYETFLSCRHAGPHAGTELDRLSRILDEVERQRSLVIDADDPLPDDAVPESRRWEPDALESNWSTSPVFERLLALVVHGTRDAQRLFGAKDVLAVRSIGYALHMIPDLLRHPEEFDPVDYRFCFRIVACHWSELSPEFQRLLCTAAHCRIDRVDELIAKEGFVIRKWDRPRRTD